MTYPSLHDALESTVIPRADAKREETVRMVAPARRRRLITLLGAGLAAVAFALSPAGPATADLVRDGLGFDHAASCPAVQQAYESHGIHVDTFQPGCPTLDQARSSLAEQEALATHEEQVRERSLAPLRALLEQVRDGGQLKAALDPDQVQRVLAWLVAEPGSPQDSFDEDEAIAVLKALRAAGDLPPAGAR